MNCKSSSELVLESRPGRLFASLGTHGGQTFARLLSVNRETFFAAITVLVLARIIRLRNDILPRELPFAKTAGLISRSSFPPVPHFRIVFVCHVTRTNDITSRRSSCPEFHRILRPVNVEGTFRDIVHATESHIVMFYTFGGFIRDPWDTVRFLFRIKTKTTTCDFVDRVTTLRTIVLDLTLTKYRNSSFFHGTKIRASSRAYGSIVNECETRHVAHENEINFHLGMKKSTA